MKRTFLVTLDLDPMDNPQAIAQDLLEDIQDAGYPVTAVAPWASPNTTSAEFPVTNIGSF